MKERLLKVLVCPSCKSDFSLKVSVKAKGEIKTGSLSCKGCNLSFPIRNFIPRFTDDDLYAKNFSKEWAWYEKVLDKIRDQKIQEEYFLKVTGFSKKEVKNKLMLDAGQGAGIGMEMFLDSGAEVIGVDIAAVDTAFNLYGSHPKAHIVQASVFDLPFKSGVFDYVYSIGVLYHTPDCKKAFFSLPKLLKKNGKLAVWLCPWQGLYSILTNFWRLFTTRLPRNVLFKLCEVGVEPLCRFRKIPVIGHLGKLIPIGVMDNKYWSILCTYDWYSPKYQSKHTNEEIVGWFKEAKFKKIKVLPHPVTIQGMKV